MMLQKTPFAAGASRARSVRVCAKQQNTANVAQMSAAIAAAVMLQAAPAMAGVVLEQPQLKKVFQSEATPAAAAPAAKSAPKAKAAAAPAPKREVVESTSSEGLDPKTIALPAALVVVGGGAFALTTVDAGFSEFMRTAAVKDSAMDGAGYETDLKANGGLKPKKAGTTKVKKASSKGKSAPTSPLGSLFGGDK